MLSTAPRGSRLVSITNNLLKLAISASLIDHGYTGYRITETVQFQCNSRRSVVFARTHNNRKRSNKVNTVLRPRNDNFKAVEKELGLKLDNLTKLTQQVQGIIKKQKEQEATEKAKKVWNVNEIDYDNGVEEDADAIFKALSNSRTSTSSSGPNLLREASSGNLQVDDLTDWANPDTTMSIFPKVHSYVELPTSIADQLDDAALQSIASKETANWIPVIDKLYEDPSCLQNSSSYEAHVLLRSIPKVQRPAVISKFYEIAKESGLLDNSYLYNDILSCYNKMDIKRSKPIIEKLYKEMTVEKGLKPDIFTIGVMVNMYGKDRNVNGVRVFLRKIEELGEHPNSAIYTSILQMYIRMNEYESAKEIFDTMKFLSLETAPTSRTFSSMILLDTLHDNVEHGIDLYDEMKTKNVKIEAQALLALVKGCSTRRNLIHQGWSFILEYYSLGYPASYKLMEIMLALSARDSDLNFARGLYLNIFETNTKANHGILTPPRAASLKYLLNAYYYFQESMVPNSVTDTRVRAIKASSLELMNFNFSDKAPPMLPVRDLSFADNKAAIFEEARALFNYHMLMFPDMVSEQIMEAYLFVLAVHSDTKTFLAAWNKYTYLENGEDGASNDETVTIEEPKEEEKVKENEFTKKDDDNEKLPVEKELDKPPKRFPRSDRLYNACMHAARNYKDVKFAQKIWIERGKYRKTPAFQKLDAYTQDQLDFRFARAMLSCLVETGNAVDAYQLVLSSQNRFVWTYYHLKSLFSLCERMGFVTFKTELEKVVNRGARFIRRSQR